MAKSVFTSDYSRFLIALRKARLEAGLTQSQVASIIRKPQSYVSKCESGERRVDAIELAAFAKIYNKPISFFVSLDNKK